MVGAFVTNAALAAGKPVQQGLRDICDDPNPEILKERFLQIRQSESLFQTDRDASALPTSHLIEGLSTCWTVLKQAKMESKPSAKQRLVVERP